ncbi:hypothetical protein P8452_77084 [Trifolium repens]|nr:hypothetical protein P8452_77084 [Trifolium repens]
MNIVRTRYLLKVFTANRLVISLILVKFLVKLLPHLLKFSREVSTGNCCEFSTSSPLQFLEVALASSWACFLGHGLDNPLMQGTQMELSSWISDTAFAVMGTIKT